MGLRVDYLGEDYPVEENAELIIGRDGDLAIDDNPYLHRRFLRIAYSGAIWWLINIGAQLTARVRDDDRRFEAWLAPGGSMPIAFGKTVVSFTAGSTTYDFDIHVDDPPTPVTDQDTTAGDGTTKGRVTLTPDQRLLVLALVETALKRGDGSAAATLPSSAQAAQRLGWGQKKFDRKLDNVCDKLTRIGIRGLHGNIGNQAANRRARLADYALATGLVSRDDLALLGKPHHPPTRTIT